MADMEQPFASSPIPIVSDPESADYYNGEISRYKPASAMDEYKNLSYQALDELPTMQIADIISRKDDDRSDPVKLDPNALNKKYPGLPMPFAEPMSDTAAKGIYEKHQEKSRIEEVISRGPHGFMLGAYGFGAGMAAGIIDPVNLAGGLAVNEALSGVKAASKLGQFGKHAVAGTLGNLPGEAVSAYNKTDAGEEYSLGEGLKGAVEGGVGFAVLGVAGGALKRALKPSVSKFLSRIGNGKAEAMVHETAIHQAEAGQVVNVEPIAKSLAVEAQAKAPKDFKEKNPTFQDYEYRPLVKTEGTEFFHGTERAGEDFKNAKKQIIENEYGTKGVYLTDSNVAANGHAARSINETVGQVYSVELKGEPSLLRMEEKAPPAVQEILKEHVREAYGEETDAKVAEQSVKQTMDDIRALSDDTALDEHVLDQINEKLQAAGYDGLHHEGGNFMGSDGPKHNIVMLFDHAETGDAGGKIVEKAKISPNRELVNQPSHEEIAQMAENQHGEQGSLFHDPVVEERLKALEREPLPELDERKIKEEVASQLEDLKMLRDQGHFSGEDLKLLEQIMESAKDAEKVDTIMKHAMICVGKAI